MFSEIHSYQSIKTKILDAVEKFSQPIISTLTPKGCNTICQTSDGLGYFVTNDGVTIAKQISFEDPIEDMVAQFLKHSSLKTNYEVGDGTTTSILLAREFIREGFKLIDGGWNPMILTKQIEEFNKLLLEEINNSVHKIENDEDLTHIASVASSNNQEITENTVKAIKAAGIDGHIIVEDSPKTETEVEIEKGFLIDVGMFTPHFTNTKGKMKAQYEDVKVLITDKRIYYPEEALSILRVLFEKGIKDIVIVAKDFIGTVPNTFITNHVQGNMRILLVKPKDDAEETLEDLACYLGTKVISESKGDLLTKITLEDFGQAKKVVSDLKKTVILNQTQQGDERISFLKEEIEKTKGDTQKDKLKKRLARMTSGTVMLYVGGRTAPEVKEKMMRYDDAISATRASLKDGYVVGGGLTLAKSFFNLINHIDQNAQMLDISKLFERVCFASLKQIAINCDIHYPTLLSKVMGEETKTMMGMKVVGDNIGYNASTNQYEDLLKAGIIEPISVTRSSLNNALSVAQIILSSKYIINLVPEKQE